MRERAKEHTKEKVYVEIKVGKYMYYINIDLSEVQENGLKERLSQLYITTVVTIVTSVFPTFK